MANFCNPCHATLNRICDNKNDRIDQGLRIAISSGKKNVRDQAARSLARDLCKTPQDVAALVKAKDKQIKALKDQLRRGNGFRPSEVPEMKALKKQKLHAKCKQIL